MAREGNYTSFYKFFYAILQASAKELKVGISTLFKKCMKNKKPNICHFKNY